MGMRIERSRGMRSLGVNRRNRKILRHSFRSYTRQGPFFCFRQRAVARAGREAILPFLEISGTKSKFSRLKSRLFGSLCKIGKLGVPVAGHGRPWPAGLWPWRVRCRVSFATMAGHDRSKHCFRAAWESAVMKAIAEAYMEG